MAHASMLGAKKIIATEESEKIIEGLGGILDDIESGKLSFDMESEDIHMFSEAELTKRIGDLGKKLHTARSRNDQVALDLRMYLRERREIIGLIKACIAVLSKAEEHKSTIMPGTLSAKGPAVTFRPSSHGNVMMQMRDDGRLQDASCRMNLSPQEAALWLHDTNDTEAVTRTSLDLTALPATVLTVFRQGLQRGVSSAIQSK
jgi:argininosuccinate lyase